MEIDAPVNDLRKMKTVHVEEFIEYQQGARPRNQYVYNLFTDGHNMGKK
ncbi:hypothetical protein [Bacillus canaveralius]|nr:hypothetical protein [Bacillus canaveralius]